MDEIALLHTATRRHAMPFGTAMHEDGGIAFRLWAPTAQRVELLLEADAPLTMPMSGSGDGWFQLTTSEAKPGTLYRFRIDGDLAVPDPASRYQPQDVHGASQVVAPEAFHWKDTAWQGRPWEETVLYELHVGTFTPEGTFVAVIDKLDELIALGITAIELMPVADFPGKRNWGYDGVLPYAPDSAYGHPDDLKRLVEAAHAKGLMVFLDVVYNHFGPEGNYLYAYAKAFFTDRHQTPWGDGLNFDGPGSDVVRSFFIHNALYWLEEFHLDGLRFDAVHAIADDTRPDIIEVIAAAVHDHFKGERLIHLVLENDNNCASYLRRNEMGQPVAHTAQWNDDLHHILHVLTTGEGGGYYADYVEQTSDHLGRCLTSGFDYQGTPSANRGGEKRGEPSGHLPPVAFVNFLQNHDQIGNRAFGDRLAAIADPGRLHAALAVLLLSPQIPLLFMGEEWGATQPFPFFCDFGPELAPLVSEGRRKEFAAFPEFADPANRERIPDPEAEATFRSAMLDWQVRARPENREWLARYATLLTLRRETIVPWFQQALKPKAEYLVLSDRALSVSWTRPNGETLVLLVNFEDTPVSCAVPTGQLLYETAPEVLESTLQGRIPPKSCLWVQHGMTGR